MKHGEDQVPEGIAIDNDSINLWQSIQDEQFQELERIREEKDIDRLIAEQEEKMEVAAQVKVK